MSFAARSLDNATHPAPAINGMGSEDVEIAHMGAWRALKDKHTCSMPPPPPPPHGQEMVVKGSMTVLINNAMAARAGDILIGMNAPNPIVAGCTSVMIGDIPFGLADPANMEEY